MFRPPFALLASGLAASVALTLAPSAAAQEEREGAAMSANRGPRLGVGPELLLPSDGGPIGGGVVFDGRYGFRAGPTVLAPGGRLAAAVISSRLVGTAMPTFRVTLPVGPFAPFITAGVGWGGLANPSESGVALLAGGGLMVHVGRLIALGAELSYQRITGTELEVLGIGPSLHVGG
jgi:hypothetical protein